MNVGSAWVIMLPQSVQLDIHQALFDTLSLDKTLDTPEKLNEAINLGMHSRLESLEEIIDVGRYVERLTDMGWTLERRELLENK